MKVVGWVLMAWWVYVLVNGQVAQYWALATGSVAGTGVAPDSPPPTPPAPPAKPALPPLPRIHPFSGVG